MTRLHLAAALCVALVPACLHDFEGDLSPTTAGFGGFGGGPPCPEGETLCGDVCANIADDHAHCGMCDRSCDADQKCMNGACI